MRWKATQPKASKQQEPSGNLPASPGLSNNLWQEQPMTTEPDEHEKLIEEYMALQAEEKKALNRIRQLSRQIDAQVTEIEQARQASAAQIRASLARLTGRRRT